MLFVVGPVDVVGNLWVIRPGDASLAPLEPLPHPHSSAELHVARGVAIDGAIVRALSAGRCVSLFERGATFAARIERIVARLAQLGITVEWRWAEMRSSDAENIDDERGALAWFLRHSPELLFVESVAFEKRRRPTPPAISRPRSFGGASATSP
jgi:hypothetical protein